MKAEALLQTLNEGPETKSPIETTDKERLYYTH